MWIFKKSGYILKLIISEQKRNAVRQAEKKIEEANFIVRRLYDNFWYGSVDMSSPHNLLQVSDAFCGIKTSWKLKL